MVMVKKGNENEGIGPKKLYRSRKNRIIAGVAGGLGEFLDIDPTVIRVLFVLLTIFGGSGIVIYIVLWFLMPQNPKDSSAS